MNYLCHFETVSFVKSHVSCVLECDLSGPIPSANTLLVLIAPKIPTKGGHPVAIFQATTAGPRRTSRLGDPFRYAARVEPNTKNGRSPKLLKLAHRSKRPVQVVGPGAVAQSIDTIPEQF